MVLHAVVQASRAGIAAPYPRMDLQLTAMPVPFHCQLQLCCS